MDSVTKGKSFNLILLPYFVLLPFVFFSSILDPFLLARQLLTSVLLFFMLVFLIKNNTAEIFIVDKAVLLFLGFTLFCSVSFFQSQIPDLSHAALSKYLVFLLFFVLVRHLLINDLITATSLKSYVILFGVLSILIASLAFLNKTINGQNLFRQVDFMSGTFGNKNFLSSILFFCLPFYFVGLLMSKRIKTIAIVAIVLTLILLVLLRTRVVLIALGVYLFLMLMFQIKIRFSKKTFYAISVIPAVLLVACIWYLFSIKNNLHSSSDISIQYFYRLLSSKTFYSRMEFWQQALYSIQDNFFNGIGVGNWINTYPKYGLHHFSDLAIQNGRMIVTYPHNDFLMVLSEIGIFGFLCYAGIFVTILCQAFWLSKNEPEGSDRKKAAYFLFFIICYVIIAFFDFPLTRIEHQIVLLVVFAIISAKYVKAKNINGFTISSRLAYLIGFILLLYSTLILVYRINGEQHLSLALEAETRGDNATAVFEFNNAKNPFFSTDTNAIPIDWHIGKAQYNEGSFEESLSSYSAAYKVNPHNLVVNNDLASTYVKNGNVPEAIKHYKEALALSPRYEDAIINLAATYYNMKEDEKAFETIDKCNIHTKNEFYRQTLAPIVEIKLNAVLIKLNNPELNSHLKSKIKSVDDLLELYFDYKKNNTTFDSYIQTLIH